MPQLKSGLTKYGMENENRLYQELIWQGLYIAFQKPFIFLLFSLGYAQELKVDTCIETIINILNFSVLETKI